MCEAASHEFIQGTSDVKSLEIEDLSTQEPQIEIGSNFQELLIFTYRIDLYQIYKKNF